jgi:CBS domain-containing protein
MATVGEIMSRDLLTVEPGAAIADVVRQMHEREVGAVLVLTGEQLVGIFTERDVLHAAATGRLEGTKVEDLMSRHPETIDASDGTGHAAAMMIHGGFRHLPVEEGGTLVGIVSIRDLMRHVLDDEIPRGA